MSETKRKWFLFLFIFRPPTSSPSDHRFITHRPSHTRPYKLWHGLCSFLSLLCSAVTVSFAVFASRVTITTAAFSSSHPRRRMLTATSESQQPLPPWFSLYFLPKTRLPKLPMRRPTPVGASRTAFPTPAWVSTTIFFSTGEDLALITCVHHRDPF